MNMSGYEKRSAVYFGSVMHQRMFPVHYAFQYKVMSLRVEVDRIEEEIGALKGFCKFLSLNRFNLYSLNYKDFGARDGKPWRPWLESLLAEYGVEKAPKRIELVCSPRFLGIVFNPLAVWYAYDEQDRMIAVVGEVSNTFGQWHHYVLSNRGKPLSAQACKVQAKADKAFHVSPFIDMDCEYRFRLKAPGDTFHLGIYQSCRKQPMLVATQAATALPLTRKSLLRAALAMPFNSLKVLTMIHWWALKIWFLGGKFHHTPKKQANVKYSHSEMLLC
ncbi:DUF1365 domain-containing protein [Thiomicrorhabdus xiamenensis]|nr:DUF1365 domain-containing protein [Thiomicrorhabdus xiamenensis]